MLDHGLPGVFRCAVSESTQPRLPSYRLTMEMTRSGQSVPVIDCGGRRYWLESQYDPDRDAMRSAEAMALLDGECVALMGGGVRLIRTILAARTGFQLIYYEPFPELRQAATPADPRLTIVDSAEALCQHVRDLDLLSVIRFRGVLAPALKPILSGYAAAVFELARREFNDRVSEVQTYLAIGELIVTNIVTQIPRLGRMSTLKSWISGSKAARVCVVASGPSLDRSAEELARVQGRLRIVAALSAAPSLLEWGIRPDAVICLDPRPEEADPLRLIPEPERRRLDWIVSVGLHPELFRMLESCRCHVFCGDHPLEKWLADRFGPPGVLSAGGSVIIPAVDLAFQLGATDLVLVGADFSVGSGSVPMTHSRGTARIRQWVSGSNRFETFESVAFRSAADHAPRRIVVDEEAVRTGENLLAYRRQVEEALTGYEGRCRHLFPAVPVRGAQGCETLRELENEPIIDKERAPTAPAWSVPGRIRQVTSEIEDRLTAGISADELFRSALESRVYRRHRDAGGPVDTVVSAAAVELAGDLRKKVGRAWQQLYEQGSG